MGRDPAPGSNQEAFNLSPVGLGWVGSGRVGSGRAGSGQKVLKISRVGLGSAWVTRPHPTRPDHRVLT